VIEQKTRADYDRATRKAFWNQIKNLARLPIAGQHYRGLAEVPVAAVAGSVGRYRDFDRAFLPRQRNTKERWLSIDKAHYQDVKLPPVELYKIGEVYFVKDGNHRISVAREREQEFIDAYVIEIETPVPLTPETDLDDLIRKAEQADFFAKTNLHRLRPDNQIFLTLPGQYGKLLEHIHVHRWYLGVENQREMGWEEAVQSWYDRVYLPLIEYIRSEEILKDFPNRSETDLYLWIIEHRSSLRGDPNATPVEEAASDFVQKRSERPVKRVLRAVKETLNSLGEFAEHVVEQDLILGGALTEEPEEEEDESRPA
jgi:hypothetical protein